MFRITVQIFFLLFALTPSIAWTNSASRHGGIDGVDKNLIQGWVCGASESPAKLQIHFFSNRNYNFGILIGSIALNVEKKKLSDLRCERGFSYYFVYNLSHDIKNRLGPGKHEIHAYVISEVGDFNLLNPIPAVLEVSGQKVALSKSLSIDTDCRYFHDQNWNLIPLPQGRCGSGAYWSIRGTNEDQKFQNQNYFLPNDEVLAGILNKPASRPYWSYYFQIKSDGKFKVNWVLDKMNHDLDRDLYSAAMLNLNASNFMALPNISDNIFIDVRVKLMKFDQKANDFLSKSRTTVGVVANWKDSLNKDQEGYVEVNLFKTANFDLCNHTNLSGYLPKVNCDPDGVYDRRSDYSSGEVVYYDVNNLDKVAGVPQTALVQDGKLHEFTLPIAELIRKYPWARPPVSWNEAKIRGMYIGHEIQGAAILNIEFDNYLIYSFVAD